MELQTMSDTTTQPPPTMGMQSFEQVQPDQMPDPTPVVQDQSLLDGLLSFGSDAYFLLFVVSTLWLAISVFSPGPPSGKAALLAGGMFFAYLYL